MPDYIIVGRQDLSVGGGSFPLTMTLPPISGIQPFDVLVVAFFINGSFAGSTVADAWVSALAAGHGSTIMYDTLDSFALTYGQFPFAGADTDPSSGQQQYSAIQFAYLYAGTGTDTISFFFNVDSGFGWPTTYLSAYLSAVVFRSPYFNFSTSPGNQITGAGNINNDIVNNGSGALNSLVNNTSVGFSPFYPPICVIGIISPLSGAPTSTEITYNVGGTGVICDGEALVVSAIDMIVPTPTGMLSQMALQLQGLPPPPVNTGGNYAYYARS